MEKSNKIRKKLGKEAGRLVRSLMFHGLSGLLLCLFYVSADAVSNIENTKHNLSVSGPGTIRSGTESRICVFCHTPHNASPLTPLWNKAIEPQNYTLYQSPTLRASQTQPTGVTKLCLSCHDGTIALGTVVSGANLGLDSALTASSSAYFGLDLSTHHPVSFPYSSSLPYPELADPGSLPPAILLGGGDIIQCNSCHDPHDDSRGMFLVMDNRYSALCTTCHNLNNWSSSVHATSPEPITAEVRLMLPQNRPASWVTVADWGCEVCHTPHFASSVPLLNYSSEEYCLNCHSDKGPLPHATDLPEQQLSGGTTRFNSSYPEGRGADIKGQMRKPYGHLVQPGGGINAAASTRGRPRALDGTAKCADCHNPHAVNRRKASAPDVSGMTWGVSGVDRNGMQKASVNYEYEVCFKCHADNSPKGIRVVESNLRLAFDPGNPSYHPVIEVGKGYNVPSIVSQAELLRAESRLIYCTDCHRDDSGVSRGPHGSSFSAILGDRYETDDYTNESYQSYALCYGCHDRTSILRDDSFVKNFYGRGGHSGHLQHGAPCSACHDPHGVVDNGMSGSHTHLINFDTTIVSAVSGGGIPIFKDLGTFSGSCTLVCHGRTHIDESYPQAGISSQGRIPSSSDMNSIRKIR